MEAISDIAFVVLVAASLLTSMISATLGMAGGVTLLAVMAALMPPVTVVPIHGAVQLGSNFTRLLVFLKSVRWPVFLYYGPAVTVGMAVASSLWSGDRLAWFRPVIGAFILLFIVTRYYKPRLRALPLWTYLPVGIAAGFLNLFVGAVGPFVAPFLLRDELRKEEVIATAAVCQFYGHLLKLPTFLLLGFDYMAYLGLMAALLAAVIVGTLLGRRILGRLPQKAFLIGFQAVLAVVAVYLMVG